MPRDPRALLADTLDAARSSGSGKASISKISVLTA